MKKFVWRLQRVLDIKKKEEQAKRTELFQLTERLAQTRGKLLRQQQILREIIRNIAERRSDERLSEQEFLLRHSTTNDDQIKRLKNELSVLETKQKQKIAEVLKIRQFKEGLEKLQAAAKREFIKEQEKLEQKELDEGATVTYARKTGARK
jgi:flagellar biosynthesis chaperone FliJ